MNILRQYDGGQINKKYMFDSNAYTIAQTFTKIKEIKAKQFHQVMFI